MTSSGPQSSRERPAGIRSAYLEAASVAVGLLQRPRVAARWLAPSSLPGMSVGALAAHVGRSVLQVEWFLDVPPRPGPLVSAVTYYARLRGTTQPDSALNRGVRSRSEETAADGHDDVTRRVGQALRRLEVRLPREPSERQVTILHHDGEAMLLDEYLATRCVELAVHLEDLALSVEESVTPPAAAVEVAMHVLVAAARCRSGDAEVLRALARRERDRQDALRVL